MGNRLPTTFNSYGNITKTIVYGKGSYVNFQHNKWLVNLIGDQSSFNFKYNNEFILHILLRRNTFIRND